MLDKLFQKLGYNKDNGLYILSESENLILENFPSRISRVLLEVIKPYAVFSLETNHNSEDHLKPFNNPIILFYNNPTTEEHQLIPKHSFNLSRSPIIIINKNNHIDIYNGFDFSENNREWLKSIDVDHDWLSISNLRNGKGWKKIHQNFFNKIKTVDRYLLSNITDARRILVAEEPNFPDGNLSPEVANRLIGRLIFIRYLIDRNVSFNDQSLLTGKTKLERQESLNSLLLDHKKTYDFFEYISIKFKGDLFPLEFENEGFPFQERYYVKKENLQILHHLLTCSNVFVGKKVRGYTVQQSLFDIYDFEIIPVELISNIYESFLGNTIFSKGDVITELSKQNEVKAYYTPPFLVDYVLSQTVKPFLSKVNGTICRVLDPSCGSGIFLVESLRQLIDKEIKKESFFNAQKKELISNERLWEILTDNIFGIDIDQNAIEITIFSLYITLLDYKTHPKEIENFEFRPLKETNLFGGDHADFFNTGNKFNRLFKQDVRLDFIIGNPPWGTVKKSIYLDYIKKRAQDERKENDQLGLNLTIGNKEISQAFMLRAGDLIQENYETKICFIVTGKNLYNSDLSALEWRRYFLSKFKVDQCFDLFGVNNKVAGGNQIFENANQPPAILLYSKKTEETNSNNLIKHIVARANLYYHYFKTIVVEKNDVKYINQNLFLIDDKLWKILLYGNSLDYLFIKEIRKKGLRISEIMKKNNLHLKGGFKSKDSGIPAHKRKETSGFWAFNYIEVESEKGLKQYEVIPSKTFKEKLEELNKKGIIGPDLKVPQIAEITAFKGVKLLIKKGLDNYLNHRAVSAVSRKDCVFSATVASISPINGKISQEQENLLYGMSALFNSKLFTYYLLMTSSSFGADRNRINYIEFLDMQLLVDPDLCEYSKQMHFFLDNNLLNEKEECIQELYKKIERKIYKMYNVGEIEEQLIDYALNISIPVMKRADRTNQKLLDIFDNITSKNINIIENYIGLFVRHFSDRFNEAGKKFVVDAYLNNNFVALHFIITDKKRKVIQYFFESDLNTTISAIGGLGINKVSSDLFIQQDIRGFNRNSFYLIKPNIKKNWHLALAHADLTEFIEAIANSELKHVKYN